jgi:hypothetical protein
VEVFEADWAETEAGQKQRRKGRTKRAGKKRGGQGLEASA